MTDIMKAAAEVRRLSAMFRSLAEIEPALDRLGSLEQAEQESQLRSFRSQKEEEAVRARMADAEKAIVLAKHKAVAVVEQANLDGGAVRARLAAEGTKLLEEAKAAITRAKAKEAASEAAERKILADVEKAKANLASLQDSVEAAKAVIARAESIQRAMRGE